MRKIILFLVLFWSAVGPVEARAEETWIVVPACGSRAPGRDDVIAHSALWQCVKAELAKSQEAYQAARARFLSRVPADEQFKFHEKMKRWDYDDGAACTKRYGLDYGCAILENDARTVLLDEALARCDAAACDVKDLP